jgi:hypothetical protein
MDDLDSLRRGKAGEEVGISDVELAWFRTIDLEDAEWQMPSPPRAFRTLIARRNPSGASAFETALLPEDGWK